MAGMGKNPKMIFQNKIAWNELALRLTWGFTGNLGLWWDRIREEDKLKLMNHDNPIEELIKAVVHEFYGNARIDSNHYADLFMNQQLCHISQLPEFLCTMQDLLYKSPDPDNVAYLRKYLSAMPGKVPDLVRDRFEELNIDITQLSLAGLHEHIVMALQKECLRRKTNKSVKKQLGFDSSVCDTFAETYHFGCNKKNVKKESCKKDCGCFKCKPKSRGFSKKYPKRFTRNNHSKKKAYFKRRPQNRQSKQSSCFICKKPGHWASQCPLRTKTKFQSKIMDLFQSGYDPSEWDLVESRSDGEYLSLTEDSESYLPEDNPTDQDSDYDSDSSQIVETMNFLDIKMMSPYTDLPSLLKQRSVLQEKLSTLTPGQFQLSRRYASQLSQLSAQIEKIQQPSVVNIHNYTPTDVDFMPSQHKDSRAKGIVKFSEPIKEMMQKENH
jgi:hypothetical protein